LLATLQGHQEGVYSVQFSSDGQRILTASLDKTARLWTVLPPSAGAAPEWFRDFLQFMAQRRLNQAGEPEWIPSTDLITMRDRLVMAAHASGNEAETPYLRLLRHFVHK
jgi:WD40 repeat protein